jgi:hypothetical protein
MTRRSSLDCFHPRLLSRPPSALVNEAAAVPRSAPALHQVYLQVEWVRRHPLRLGCRAALSSQASMRHMLCRCRDAWGDTCACLAAHALPPSHARAVPQHAAGRLFAVLCCAATLTVWGARHRCDSASRERRLQDTAGTPPPPCTHTPPPPCSSCGRTTTLPLQQPAEAWRRAQHR